MLQNINTVWPSTMNLEPPLVRVRGFLGEALKVIQLFPQKMQDLRFAYGSLVVINFVAWELGQIAASKFDWILPNEESTNSQWDICRTSINMVAGSCTIILTLKVFHDFAKLPISLDKFLAISVGVLVFRVLIESCRSHT